MRERRLTVSTGRSNTIESREHDSNSTSYCVALWMEFGEKLVDVRVGLSVNQRLHWQAMSDTSVQLEQIGSSFSLRRKNEM